MNIVLAHGFLGFRKKLGIDYFNGVQAFLEKDFAAHVLITEVDPDAGIALRSEQLRRQILAALGKLAPVSEAEQRAMNALDPQHKTHIIGHSMGGLDSRRALSPANRDNIAAHVASLTTISTPHRGSPIADLLIAGLRGFGWNVLQRFFAWRVRPLAAHLNISLEGLHDLTTDSCARFNQDFGDHPQVRYFSVAGAGRIGKRPTAKILRAAHYYIKRKTSAANDGLVSVASAQWGEFDSALWPADHADEIGHDLDRIDFGATFDHLAAFRKIAARLKNLTT